MTPKDYAIGPRQAHVEKIKQQVRDNKRNHKEDIYTAAIFAFAAGFFFSCFLMVEIIRRLY